MGQKGWHYILKLECVFTSSVNDCVALKTKQQSLRAVVMADSYSSVCILKWGEQEIVMRGAFLVTLLALEFFFKEH